MAEGCGEDGRVMLTDLTIPLRFAAEQTIKDRPRLSFEEWAPRVMGSPEGIEFSFLPYQMAPARDIFTPEIPWVALRAFSGMGKTYLFGAAFVYAIDQLGLDCGLMYPNDRTAYGRLEGKIWPFFLATPKLKKRTIATNNKGLKEWEEGGRITAVGANSSTEIRVLEIDFAYADEIDSIRQDATDEGDKVDQFLKRTRVKENVFKLVSSYPSQKNSSKIDTFFEAGDQCRWVFDCPRCSQGVDFHPDHVQAPEGKPEEAVVECPECSRSFDDKERRASSKETGRFIDALGEVVTGGEKPRIGTGRSYHVNCMAHIGPSDVAYGSYLHEIYEGREEGNKDEKKRRVFVNTMCAESYSPPEESPPVEVSELVKRRENWNPKSGVPDGVLCVTWGADVQKNRIEIEFVGWGLQDETWGLGYFVLPGQTKESGVWAALEKLLKKSSWHHEQLGTLKPVKGCIDSNWLPSEVRRWCKKFGATKAIPIIGSRTLGDPICRSMKQDKLSGVKVLTVGTHEAKEQIFDRIARGMDEPGCMHFPAIHCYHKSYFEHLTETEVGTQKQARDGNYYTFYEKVSDSARNEALDIRVYAMAAMRKLNPNYLKIMGRFKKAE